MNKEKIVYSVFVADYWHPGHQNILNECKKYGNVVIGLLTDEAVAAYKRVPILSYQQRESLIKDKDGVCKVIPQRTLDYIENLELIKPDYVVNGSDWAIRGSVQWKTRQRVIDWLDKHDGKLIEVPYTEGISSTKILKERFSRGVTPEFRIKRLKRLINVKPLVRVIEAHDGLSAIVAENAEYKGKRFDAVWDSSLCSSLSRGLPDIELISFQDRISMINHTLEAVNLPFIMDGDTGGSISHFKFTVKTLERLGISAIIIEDKKFPKINSLMSGAKHIQEEPQIFSEKIVEGKKVQITENFMIFARIESLIAGKSVDDALMRAEIYNKVADGIMIHSKDKSPNKVIEFCTEYNKIKNKLPLVIAPTTYNSLTEKEMIENGISVVIYANHLTRSAYRSMKDVASDILKYGRSLEVDNRCCSVKELFALTNSKF